MWTCPPTGAHTLIDRGMASRKKKGAVIAETAERKLEPVPACFGISPLAVNDYTPAGHPPSMWQLHHEFNLSLFKAAKTMALGEKRKLLAAFHDKGVDVDTFFPNAGITAGEHSFCQILTEPSHGKLAALSAAGKASQPLTAAIPEQEEDEWLSDADDNDDGQDSEDDADAE